MGDGGGVQWAGPLRLRCGPRPIWLVMSVRAWCVGESGELDRPHGRSDSWVGDSSRNELEYHLTLV